MQQLRIKRTKRQETNLIISIFFLTIILILPLVWLVSIRMSVTNIGYDIHLAKVKIRSLVNTNKELRFHHAKLSSPQYIEMKAKELGLEKPQPGQIIPVYKSHGEKDIETVR